MIALKPSVGIDCRCPECGSPAETGDTIISGMNVYADCTCRSCGASFFQFLPSSHFVNALVKVEKTHYRVYNSNEDYQWLSTIVQDSFPLQKQLVVIRKKIYSPSENVIILNTLDFLYGHSLLKLYNALHHLDRDKHLGLIIIAPAILEWMIPHGCSEAWIVDLSLNDFRKGYEAIQQFVEAEFMRFNKVFLSPAYSHPDLAGMDISRFTGIKPFDLQDFDTRKPCFSFVLREDRWWLNGPVDYWFYRFCRKAKLLKQGNKILTHRQNNLIKRTIKVIRKRYPSATFFIVGLGNTGDFGGFANDMRTLKPDNEKEKEWCSIYAKSHVVIGFHGSNMLLPTAFAAGCVEILPEDRYGNIVQDISVRYSDRRQLFFYRFTDQYSTPRSVASKAVAIIRDHKTYYRSMCIHVHAS